MKKNRKKIDMVAAMKKKRNSKKHTVSDWMKNIDYIVSNADELKQVMNAVANGHSVNVGMQWVEPRVLKVTRTDKNRHRLHIDWDGGRGQPDCSHVQITRLGRDKFEWYDEQTGLRKVRKLDALLWDHDLHRDKRLKQTILLLNY